MPTTSGLRSASSYARCSTRMPTPPRGERPSTPTTRTLATSPQCGTPSVILASRAATSSNYQKYIDRYEAINRFTLRGTGRFDTITDPQTGAIVRDPETGLPARGDELTARITPRALVTFRQDPQSALVRALERFDEETQGSTPAALLTQRVVVPRPTKQGAETPAEAVALSLDGTGGVDLAVVSNLLGVEPDEARTMLGDLVYEDPDSRDLIHAPEYLSGDVRTKLETAEAAAQENPAYLANVDALRAVIPDPIGIIPVPHSGSPGSPGSDDHH